MKTYYSRLKGVEELVIWEINEGLYALSAVFMSATSYFTNPVINRSQGSSFTAGYTDQLGNGAYSGFLTDNDKSTTCFTHTDVEESNIGLTIYTDSNSYGP